MMLPSREQIERAAYERWERRGRFHGADREDWVAAEMDTLFQLNYQTVAEFGLAEPEQRVLGDVRRPRCRFCEQSPPRAAFSVLRPAIPELVGNSSLYTRDLCDECAKQFADTIDAEFARFWESLEALRDGTASFREIRVPTAVPIAAYKSLIRMALSLMPEPELSSFTDTIEWVSNPDHEFDRTLFDGAGCLVYQAHVPYQRGMGQPELPDRGGCSVPVYALLSRGGAADSPDASAALCPRRGPRRHGSAHAAAVVLHRLGSRLEDQYLSGPSPEIGRRSRADAPLPAFLVMGRAKRE